MRIDQVMYHNAAMEAYFQLASPSMTIQKKNADGSVTNEEHENGYHVKPENITYPMVLCQEQPFTNAKNEFTFDFSVNGPKADATHNNVLIGQNNIACIFAIQIQIGLGDAANTREYFSHGFTPQDDSLYNSLISMKFENATLVDQMPGQQFRDVPAFNESWAMMGLVLIKPMRFITGKLGVNELKISLINPINTLNLTQSLWISAKPHCVWGQASATRS